MRKLFAPVLFLGLLAVSIPALAQENYTDGPIWRVNYIDVKAGKMNAVQMDMRENFNKVYAEAKKQGVILDYKVWLNATSEGPDDWDIATGILFKNWGAMDGLAAKMEAITLKHYGTADARQKSGDKRIEMSSLIRSALAREIMLK
jgi:hypothetical protein